MWQRFYLYSEGAQFESLPKHYHDGEKTRQSTGLSNLQTTVLSDVTRCSLLDKYRRFR
jgi:hypothetical protein